MSSPPILYSFRRCPYAMRARMALHYAAIQVELREVVLRNKPSELIAESPKATVPVLVLPDGQVIDESLQIMRWSLGRSDPAGWQSSLPMTDQLRWIDRNDGPFKSLLDQYKYADRHPQHPADWYRNEACIHIEPLEQVLREQTWLHGNSLGFCDVALFPFIRQFAMVDREWFFQSPYSATVRWLNTLLEHPLFLAVMQKYAAWEPDQLPVFLPGSTAVTRS